MSTRARLTFIFTALFGMIVVGLATATYLLERQDAYSKLDSALHTAVDATAMSAEHEFAEHNHKENGEKDVREVLLNARQAALPGIQILVREGGRNVAYRPGDQDKLDLRQASSAQLKSGTVIDGSRIQVRELDVPRFQTRYQIYSAKSVAPALDHLALLRRNLLIAVPLGLLLASFAGYLLARKALAPLSALTTTIEHITSSDLSARVTINKTGDDLSRLGASFNSLLDRLENAFAAERRFMADASHELRTPLTVGLTAVQVANKAPDRDQANSDNALQVAENQMLRLKKLVDNLLLLAQTGKSDAVLHRTEMYLDDAVSDATRAARILGQAKNQILKVDPLPEARCIGDQDLLKQCLLILLDNAVKFTPPGGQIRVKLSPKGELWSCLISDTGCGIAESAQPHIFDRFYRAPNSSPPAPGAGLGLAIAKSIMESHGGQLLLVESTPAGTTFEIVIPGLEEPSAETGDQANSLSVKM